MDVVASKIKSKFFGRRAQYHTTHARARARTHSNTHNTTTHTYTHTDTHTQTHTHTHTHAAPNKKTITLGHKKGGEGTRIIHGLTYGVYSNRKARTNSV